MNGNYPLSEYSYCPLLKTHESDSTVHVSFNILVSQVPPEWPVDLLVLFSVSLTFPVALTRHSDKIKVRQSGVISAQFEGMVFYDGKITAAGNCQGIYLIIPHLHVRSRE